MSGLNPRPSDGDMAIWILVLTAGQVPSPSLSFEDRDLEAWSQDPCPGSVELVLPPSRARIPVLGCVELVLYPPPQARIPVPGCVELVLHPQSARRRGHRLGWAPTCCPREPSRGFRDCSGHVPTGPHGPSMAVFTRPSVRNQLLQTPTHCRASPAVLADARLSCVGVTL